MFKTKKKFKNWSEIIQVCNKLYLQLLKLSLIFSLTETYQVRDEIIIPEIRWFEKHIVRDTWRIYSEYLRDLVIFTYVYPFIIPRYYLYWPKKEIFLYIFIYTSLGNLAVHYDAVVGWGKVTI